MYCFYFKSNHCLQVFIKILYLLSIFQSLKDVDLKVLPIKKPDIWPKGDCPWRTDAAA